MDKETLSQYGWIVICIIIIALMLGLATPFGNYIKDATWSALNGFTEKSSDMQAGVNGTTVIKVKDGDIVPDFPDDGIEYSEWNTSPLGDEVSYQPGDRVEVQGSISDILYAISHPKSKTITAKCYKYSLSEDKKTASVGYNGLYIMIPSLQQTMKENNLTFEEFIIANTGCATYEEGLQMDVGNGMTFKSYIEQLTCTDINTVKSICDGDTNLILDSNPNINISSTYEGVPVTTVNQFYIPNVPMHITLPETITTISDYAFNWNYGSTIVDSIKMGDNITYIGEDAFAGQDTLKEIHLSNNLQIIGASAFNSCRSLEKIDIPSTVTEIGNGAFANCEGIKTIAIPYGIVKIPDNALSGCISLESVNVPNTVTEIGVAAFSGCSNLKSIQLPNSIIKIDNLAFRESGIVNIVLPDSIMEMDDFIFDGCKSLVSVNIPKNITKLPRRTFINCKSLTSFTVPDYVTEIGEYSLGYCDNLVSVDIPISVTKIGEQALAKCVKLTDINYNGTIAQWNSINKESSWKVWTDNAIVHCTDGDIPA